MSIAGLRGTGNWGTDERPKNFREMILWLKPNGTAPLHALTSKMSKSSVNDPEFSWWEELMTIGRFQQNGTLTNSATGFTVMNGVNGFNAQSLKPGDLLLIEEGAQTTGFAWEIIEVTSITNATQFQATRAVAGSTAAIVTSATWLTLIGSAYEEGAAKAAPATRNPTKVYNYTQIFKDTYAITGTADQTYARTGDARQNDKRRKAFDHATKMEMAWIFGKRHETTGAGGKPKRYTGGLLSFLAGAGRTSVATAMVGAGGLNTLFDNVFDVFDYASDGGGAGDERICLVGNAAMNALSKAAAASGTVNFGEIVKVYGMNLTRMVMPQGQLLFKTHPLMSRHSVYTNSMFILDPPGIKYRPLQGRDTKFEDNIQLPGTDAKEGQWLTEAGLEFHHMSTMKYLGGITWAAS
jgi:hypothetical protein